MSAGNKKRTTLDTNNSHTVKAELSKRMYVHRTLTVEWESLPVVGRYWANGEIRHIITEYNIQSANDN